VGGIVHATDCYNIRMAIFTVIVTDVGYWFNVVIGILSLFPVLAAGFLVICVVVSIEVGRRWAKRRFATLLREIDAVTEKLNAAEKIGGFGSFAWDFQDPSASFWSEEMYTLFGLVPRKAPPTIDTVIEAAHKEDRESARKAWATAEIQPGPFSFTFRIVARTGQVRYLRVRGTTTIGVNKGPIRIQGVAHDITSGVEVDRAKSEFVSLAAHQLKTPLTSIKWLAEALLQGRAGALSPLQLDYMGNIELATQRMIGMVNDFLDVSRIELDTLSVHTEEIDVREMAEGVIEEQRHAADEKHVTLRLTGGAIPHLHADKGLVRMVFQNLISNAIKYTPKDGSVECEITSSGVERETIFIRISDTGIGIPKEEREHVFEKLHRAANAQAFEPNGTGLGLYVVKTIIDKVGGGITFESQEGKGTTFYVSLPLVWQESIGRQEIR
jgi:signal transduction histidine kinase